MYIYIFMYRYNSFTYLQRHMYTHIIIVYCYVHFCLHIVYLNSSQYIYFFTYIYTYVYIYLQTYIFICEYMYKYLQRYPNLSDFQSVASFVPSRSLAPAMTACFYAGRSSYNPSTIPTVRILNESGPWVSPKFCQNRNGEVVLEISEKNQSKLDDTCHGRFIWINYFLLGLDSSLRALASEATRNDGSRPRNEPFQSQYDSNRQARRFADFVFIFA